MEENYVAIEPNLIISFLNVLLYQYESQKVNLHINNDQFIFIFDSHEFETFESERI